MGEEDFDVNLDVNVSFSLASKKVTAKQLNSQDYKYGPEDKGLWLWL